MELREGENHEALLREAGVDHSGSGLKLIPLSPRLVLLRCGHLQVGELKGKLGPLELEGKLKVVGVSGTIKGAKRMVERKMGSLKGP